MRQEGGKGKGREEGRERGVDGEEEEKERREGIREEKSEGRKRERQKSPDAGMEHFLSHVPSTASRY